MSRLEIDGAESAELWQALNCLPVPSPLDSDVDRRCWWQHLYAILERHGLGVARPASMA